MIGKWTAWKPFPDPANGGYLTAPLGCGCYDLRLASTSEAILFGKSRNVASRMCSLLTREHGGTGTRKNAKKREFGATHLADLEYRTIAFATGKEADDCEQELKASTAYRHPT